MEFTKEAVVAEELYTYAPNKARIYQRTTDLERQFVEIKFGRKVAMSKVMKQSLTANTLWNNTVLGGYLITNVDSKELQEVVEWFGLYLNSLVQPQTTFDRFLISNMEEGTIQPSDIIPLLQQADLRISDIIIQQREANNAEELFLYLSNPSKGMKERGVRFREDGGKEVVKEIVFEHTVNGEKYQLPLAEESLGTKRYYEFAGLLAYLIKKPNAMLIDELESSLHPDLYRHFIVSYLLNTKDSQILATTHNRELLDDRDLFRNDAIWFTDKSNADATELYSLADFDRSVIGKKTNVLNAYKSGKLSGTPILGDTHIDLNHGKN